MQATAECEIRSTMVETVYEMPKSEETEILQKLEEKAAKAQEAFEKEEKLRKELEVLNTKLLTEKTNLLGMLEGEKGSMGEIQEKANKLQAQKSDLEQQLTVSTFYKYRLFHAPRNQFSQLHSATSKKFIITCPGAIFLAFKWEICLED